MHSNLSTAEKAAMWDALMSCQRIRMMGSAKLGDPDQQHLGLELWAKYPGDVDDSHGRDVLDRFVRVMMGPGPFTYQARVAKWVHECFGDGLAKSPKERCFRFFEEATELVQAGGMSREECYELVDYVFGREKGAVGQEIGGVMVCLAAFATTFALDMEEEAERELENIWGRIEQIRKKNESKPFRSPLPGSEE